MKNKSAYPSSPSGSIMIWSVLLGFVLTSVFLFFGLRQRSAVTLQRETAEILNRKAYMESYKNYLIDGFKKGSLTNPNVSFNEVFTGTVTNEVDEIVDTIDTNETNEYKIDGEILIEWNRSGEPLRGDMIVNGITETSAGGGSGDYQDAKVFSISSPLILQTANAPFEYRITSSTLSLLDNRWHLELSSELDYGKIISVSDIFE